MPERPMTRRRARAARRGLSVVSAIGELLVTAGVLVLLYVAWYAWVNDVIVGGEQTRAAAELQQEWAEQSRGDRGEPGEPPPPAVEALSPELAPVLAEPTATNEPFATLRAPRFGADYARTIAQGIDVAAVLNSRRTGVGHYPGTQMPGELGNFAVAAHRNANGAPFGRLLELRVGDHIYIETAAGWYEYTFRGLEYVLPTQVDVIAPVPRAAAAPPEERYLTMTTCNPLFSTAERAIAYSVMTGWYPREGGMPVELSTMLNGEA